ncbi:hypothetical protein [Kingella potus]|uniref:hypothetical protein n=1 Tax=Kingella potus TaxID=265175 RepID=UPI001FD11C23|nr:hypothetical protein [Kingella potus]UOP01970.1 hypothetical protein LVJ84_01200 [Kingella potus]
MAQDKTRCRSRQQNGRPSEKDFSDGLCAAAETRASPWGDTPYAMQAAGGCFLFGVP